MRASKRILAIGMGTMIAIALAGSAHAQTSNRTPTYYKDILPILQTACQECHREAGPNFVGMVAPFALIDYETVRPWSKAIAREVSAKTMPPWFASDAFDGIFELQRSLTDEQIELIVRWSQTGARAGDINDAPPPRVFPTNESGWLLGEPDLILEIPEPYWVADEIDDVQPRFFHILTEEELPADKWVNWIEFRPGTEIVHHGGCSVQPLNEDGTYWSDPFSGGKLIGTAPGDGPDVWPLGYGKLVRKGSLIRWGLHYHKEKGPGTGMMDRSSIGIKWHEEPVNHVVRAAGISSRGWEIPPQNNNWKIGAVKEFTEDTYLINFMPHMHFRGKSATWEAFYPDGSTETLLDVPKWDYQWQRTYTYREPKFLPAGTRVEVAMVFDNSSENTWTPNPNRGVWGGARTQDEMNIGWTEYANAAPIDDVFNSSIKDEKVGATADAQFDDDLFAQRKRESDPEAAAQATSQRAPVNAFDLPTVQIRPPSGRGEARPETRRDERLDAILELGTEETVEVYYPESGIGEMEFAQLAGAEAGDILYFARNTSVKLATDVDLKFGDALIEQGNATKAFDGHYPGVYGLWLQKGEGEQWSLVINADADVLGTMHDPAQDVAVVPLTSKALDAEAETLSVKIDKRDGGGRLSIAWGKTEWSVDFEIN